MDREIIEYDVVVVGGGPGGLAAAIRLKQLARDAGAALSVCLLEKGAEIGAHILSGAVLDPRALDELLPGWRGEGGPAATPVAEERLYLFESETSAKRVPGLLCPRLLGNRGNYLVSLGGLCRWLGARAEALGVEIFPGFAAATILYDNEGGVTGVATADQGVGADGHHKPGYTPGLDVLARYVVLAEGSRGHLGRQLILRFALDRRADPQHFAIGFKELWRLDPARHRPGLVIHGAGWPLSGGASGGSFMYHLGDNLAAVGLVVDLDYQNPYLDPYAEFQRMKHHPVFSDCLEGGERLGYGARSITKGGHNSLPRLTVPGALLVGCNAGTLDFARIKGIHTAMKSGMVAAETIHVDLAAHRDGGRDLVWYDKALRRSWAGRDLYRARNFYPALKKFGPAAGGAFSYLEQSLFRGYLPFTLRERRADHTRLQSAARSARIDYPKPDRRLSFDRAASVYLSNTRHEEDQPCHLVLKDENLPVTVNLPDYAAPEQRYCPAGVYEIVEAGGGPALRIHATDCIHCKTCDIKDPNQNIVWVPPEGGGPNYGEM